MLMQELDRLENVENVVTDSLRKMAQSYKYDELLSVLPQVKNKLQHPSTGLSGSA